MKKIRTWLEEQARRRPILKNVLVLFTGTAIAQSIAMVIAIFTARMFPPEVFGQMAIYGAIVSVVISIGALRFDMTVVLPKDDDEARVLGRLAHRSIVVISLSVTLLALLLRDVIIKIWGDATLATWMPLAGLTAFFVCHISLLQYWYNRKRRYGVIARNNVQQVVGSSGGQLVFGLAGLRTMPGLLFGAMIGQAGAFLFLNYKAKDFRQKPGKNAPTMWQMAKRYKKMPLLNLPNTLIDAVRSNGIVMLIGTIALNAVGQFNLAWQCLQVPIGLINSAVQQVFFRELAEVKPGAMRPLVRATIKRAAILSAIPFGIIYLIAPWLFTFVFGSQWDMAGEIARALTPWLAVLLVSSPITTVFVVTEKQQWMLGLAAVLCIASLGWLYASPLAFLPTVQILGIIMASLFCMQIFLADLAAGSYDKMAHKEER